jgi:hypothetical protein
MAYDGGARLRDDDRRRRRDVGVVELLAVDERICTVAQKRVVRLQHAVRDESPSRSAPRSLCRRPTRQFRVCDVYFPNAHASLLLTCLTDKGAAKANELVATVQLLSKAQRFRRQCAV